jgi:hypothetical protein
LRTAFAQAALPSAWYSDSIFDLERRLIFGRS